MVKQLVEWAGLAGEIVELVGVLIIIGGFVHAFVTVVLLKQAAVGQRLQRFRTRVKTDMLLGLDFLVAGDIIRTVTVDSSLTGVASLGFLVLIRTALVFTIHLEIEGHWPWQRPAA